MSMTQSDADARTICAERTRSAAKFSCQKWLADGHALKFDKAFGDAKITRTLARLSWSFTAGPLLRDLPIKV
ncbi:MAG: hypothetical protein WCR59_06415 [Planctomycetota bacterium]|jgi:hypothetical protein